jgi:hypothetical protein
MGWVSFIDKVLTTSKSPVQLFGPTQLHGNYQTIYKTECYINNLTLSYKDEKTKTFF